MRVPIPRRSLMRVIPTAAAAVVTAGLLVACDGDRDTSGDPLTVGGMEETVVIEDFKFKPGNLQVPAGASVTWENRDSAPHDATDDDGEWETERLGEDDADTLTFDTPGEYTYHCSIHPNMKAKLTVVAE